MNWLRRLGQNRLLDVGVLVLAVLLLIKLAAALPARMRANDFAHYYLGSRLVLEGRDPYTTPLASLYAEHGFVYEPAVPVATNPPALLWLFAPWALLPVAAAFWAWAAAQALALAGVLWLARRLLAGQLTARGWYFVAVATVGSAAVDYHFDFAQVQLSVAALLLGALLAQQSGRHGMACLLVALAGLLKLYPLALLPWFVWRADGCRWRCAWVALAVLVGGVVVTEPGLWRGFAEHAVGALAQCAINHTFNYTWPSLVTNLGLADYGFAPPLATARAWWWAGAATGAALLAGAYWLVLRCKGDMTAEFSLLCVVMVVAAMTSRGHYLVFLAFPMAAAAVRVAAEPTLARVAGSVLVLVMLNNMDTWQGGWLDRHLVAKVLCNYTPLAGMTLLGGFWAEEVRREQR